MPAGLNGEAGVEMSWNLYSVHRTNRGDNHSQTLAATQITTTLILQILIPRSVGSGFGPIKLPSLEPGNLWAPALIIEIVVKAKIAPFILICTIKIQP